MLIITDAQGLLHIIPRERLVNISMFPPEPRRTHVLPDGQQVTAGDPPETKIRLVIFYETTTPTLGQMIFCFSDDSIIASIKNTLAQWAVQDGPNHLVINAGQPPAPTPPPAVASISI